MSKMAYEYRCTYCGNWAFLKGKVASDIACKCCGFGTLHKTGRIGYTSEVTE